MTEIALVSGVSFVMSRVSCVHVLLGIARLCSKPRRKSYIMGKLSYCCAPAQLKEQSQDAKAVRDKQNRLLQRRLEKRDLEVGILIPYLALALFCLTTSRASLFHAPSCSPEQDGSFLFRWYCTRGRWLNTGCFNADISSAKCVEGDAYIAPRHGPSRYLLLICLGCSRRALNRFACSRPARAHARRAFNTSYVRAKQLFLLLA